MKIKNKINFKAWIAILLFVLSPLVIIASSFVGKCVSIADGDTISVMKDGKAVKIRLDGIDCPELGQDFSDRAKQFTSIWTFEQNVEVRQTDTDKYGRTVAGVIVGDKDVSLELIRAGLAWHYKEYSKDTILANAELEARKAKIGIWSLQNSMPPWNYRHGGAKPTTKELLSTYAVYVTNTGKKYHKDGCKYLAKSKIPISEDDAIDQGYGSCSVCIGSAKIQQTIEPETKSETVYITKTGSKYHRSGCSYLSKSMISISKEDAIKRGYGACSRCRP